MMRLMDSDETILALERAGLELGARGRIEEAANCFIAARILRESALLRIASIQKNSKLQGIGIVTSIEILDI